MRHLALSTALAALVLAAPASAAELFTGRTSQDRRVTLRTGDDGRLTRFVYRWSARCRGAARARFGELSINVPPWDESSPAAFRDASGYTPRLGGGYRGRVSSIIAGTRRTGPDRWSGTIRVRLTIRRGGRPAGTCRTGTIRWSARRR